MNRNKDDKKSEDLLDFYKKKIDTAEYQDRKKTTVIWDGRQYSIRIPKKFADLVGVEKGDKFLFKIWIPSHDSDKKAKLMGEWLGEEE